MKHLLFIFALVSIIGCTKKEIIVTTQPPVPVPPLKNSVWVCAEKPLQHLIFNGDSLAITVPDVPVIWERYTIIEDTLQITSTGSKSIILFNRYNLSLTPVGTSQTTRYIRD